MRNYLYKNRVFIPILTISILYNVLWFSFFIFLLLNLPDYRFTITVGFLVFYMIIAEPAKDTFIHFIFFKPLYPGLERKSIKDTRIKELASTGDVPKLLKVLVKDFNITFLNMIIKDHSYKISDFSKENNKPKKIVTGDLDTIFQNGNLATDEAQSIFNKYQWHTVLPIIYKSNLFGFIAFEEILDAKRREIFESLASRIALLIENDTLTESALINQAFKKEFSAARKMERFLIEEKTLTIGKYSVVFKQNHKNSEDDHVLFENSLKLNPGEKTDENYLIYCKISKSNKRKRIMILFIISGYFLSISKNSKDLNSLIEALNKAIFENGKEFAIEGFILSHKNNANWRISHFGDSTDIIVDQKKIKIKKNAPLGTSEKTTYKPISYSSKNEISLAIYPGSQLNIKKNEK